MTTKKKPIKRTKLTLDQKIDYQKGKCKDIIHLIGQSNTNPAAQDELKKLLNVHPNDAIAAKHFLLYFMRELDTLRN